MSNEISTPVNADMAPHDLYRQEAIDEDGEVKITYTVGKDVPKHAAAVGDQYWHVMARNGFKKVSLGKMNPEQFFLRCMGYFAWLHENPLEDAHVSAYQGEVNVTPIAKMRVPTWWGLALYVGCNPRDLTGILQGRYCKHLHDVMIKVDSVMRAIKFEGAAAGLLNANLIARDLGIADKTELTGADGKPLQTVVQYQLPANGRDEIPEADEADEAEEDSQEND